MHSNVPNMAEKGWKQGSNPLRDPNLYFSMSFWKRLLERTGLAETPGEVVRRQHSVFLTNAILSGKQYPRIPTRVVSECKDGFNTLMSRKHGPEHAEKWWNLALERVE